MKRREFIALLGGAAAAWPFGARAQQPTMRTKIPHIGYIGITPRPPDEAFREGLRELGYKEGQNIVIEFRWIERSGRTAAEEVDDLVRSKPDVILAVTSPPTRAAKDATSTIPIVFVDIGDPVAYGFFPSLARLIGRALRYRHQGP